MRITSLNQDTPISALSIEGNKFKVIPINALPASPSFHTAVIWAYATFNLLAQDKLIA